MKLTAVQRNARISKLSQRYTAVELNRMVTLLLRTGATKYDAVVQDVVYAGQLTRRLGL